MAATAASHLMRAILVKPDKLKPSLFLSEVPMPKLFPGNVLIKVGACGVNRMDLMQKAGKYPPPPGISEILGPEAAGVVVGGSGFLEGTRVACLLQGGGYAEYVAVHPGLCFPIPHNLTVKQAACIPENWLTAYQLLQKVARISDFPSNGGKPSGIKHVLVYAAASGVGVALLQILREFLPAAKVLAVVGSEAKREFAKSLGAAESLNYKELGDALADEVLKLTNGKGVELALDCVGASLFPVTLKALNTDSIWLLYGCLGGHKATVSLASLLQKRVHLLTTTLRSRSEEYRVELVKDFSDEVMPRLRDGAMQVVFDSAFPAEAADAAHEKLEKDLNIGKVVIVINEEIAQMHGNPKP